MILRIVLISLYVLSLIISAGYIMEYIHIFNYEMINAGAYDGGRNFFATTQTMQMLMACINVCAFIYAVGQIIILIFDIDSYKNIRANALICFILLFTPNFMSNFLFDKIVLVNGQYDIDFFSLIIFALIGFSITGLHPIFKQIDKKEFNILNK